MKYNEENYEQYALDYVEGNMSGEDRAEFEVFLLLHPEIQEIFNQFEIIEVPSQSNLVFPHKSQLLRDEDNGKIIFFGRKMMSIAASVLIILAVGIYLLQNEEKIPMANTDGVTLPATSDDHPMDELVHEDKRLKKGVRPPIQFSEGPKAKEKEETGKEMEDYSRKKVIPSGDPVPSPVVEDVFAKQILVADNSVNDTMEEIKEVSKSERGVLNLEKLESRSIAFIPEIRYRVEFTDFGILEINEDVLNEKQPSKFKRFLAKANLIPNDFTNPDYVSFKEKLLPETIPGLK